jgi:hypothetical protein
MANDGFWIEVYPLQKPRGSQIVLARKSNTGCLCSNFRDKLRSAVVAAKGELGEREWTLCKYGHNDRAQNDMVWGGFGQTGWIVHVCRWVEGVGQMV